MTREQAQAVYIAGQRMSNWLYNMCNNSNLTAFSAGMRKMVDDWDNLKSPLAVLTIPKDRSKRKTS